MRSLNQQSAAELVGKTTSSLRDNLQLYPRNADGTYDARELVASVLANASDPVPVNLSDDELEPLLLIFGWISPPWPCDWLYGAIDALNGLKGRHGTAGLAAIGAALIDHIELSIESRRKVIDHDSRIPTPEAYRQSAERSIEEIPMQQEERNKRRSLRAVVVCRECGAWRKGSKWLSGKPPAGHLVLDGCCTPCSDKP